MKVFGLNNSLMEKPSSIACIRGIPVQVVQKTVICFFLLLIHAMVTFKQVLQATNDNGGAELTTRRPLNVYAPAFIPIASFDAEKVVPGADCRLTTYTDRISHVYAAEESKRVLLNAIPRKFCLRAMRPART